MKKPLQPAQQDAVALMRSVLHEGFVALQLEHLSIDEDCLANTCTVRATLREESTATSQLLEGTGVGLIDALFAAVRERFAPEHPSLDSLRFTRFVVAGLMHDARKPTATDADAAVELGVTNSYGTEFLFQAAAPSINRAAVEAVLAAAEYFVNSERAYLAMYRALQHYRSEGRHELVSKYTDQMTVMVRNTSYSAVLERLK